MEALYRAGFTDVKHRDRNIWYRVLSGKEYRQMKGPICPKLVELLGQAHADRYIEIWRAMNLVLESGELRPGHLGATKPSR